MTGEARTQPADGTTEALTWSASHYALIGEPGAGREHDVLAVCTDHQGAHIRYVDWRDPTVSWCQALPPQRRPFPPAQRQGAGGEIVRVEIANTDQLGEAIGSGLVLAFRRARAEQREERRR